MLMTSHAVEHWSQQICLCGILRYMTLGVVLCLPAISKVSAQQGVEVGAPAPAIEINEDAVYYNLPNYRQPITTPNVRLFNPLKDNLKSRVVNLRPPFNSGLSKPPEGSDGTLRRGNKPTSHVIELPHSESADEDVIITTSDVPSNSVEIDGLLESDKDIGVSSTPPKTDSNVAQASPKPQAIDSSSSDVVSEESDTPRQPDTKEIDLQDNRQQELTAVRDPQRHEPGATTLPSEYSQAGVVTIRFLVGAATFSDDNEPTLVSLVTEIKDQEGTRIQLKAYADAQNSSASAARRLSLSRALAVRSFLIESGINSTRIDVRALGSKTESGPADRVDLIIVN